MLARVLEGCLRDARGALVRDDLDALRDLGRGHVLDAGVEIFSIFAENDEIDVGIVGLQAGQGLDGTEVGIQIELLAQLHIDRRKNRRRWAWSPAPLQRDLVREDGIHQGLWNVLARLGIGVRAGIEAMPVEAAAGVFACGFEDRNNRSGDLRADARRRGMRVMGWRREAGGKGDSLGD